MYRKHLMNFGLLFSFFTLVVTGVMSYVYPFSLVTTRLHIIFSSTTIIFISYHLWQKYGYFVKALNRASKLIIKALILLTLVWLFIIIIGIKNFSAAKFFIDMSYEGRHQREVLRTSPFTASEITEGKLTTVRVADQKSEYKKTLNNDNKNGTKNVALTLEIRLPRIQKINPAIAIWAESTSGSLIETLYLSPDIAYSDTPDWHGNTIDRVNILPVWRNKFTLVSGIDPYGQIDALTGATNNHTFSLENNFYAEEGEYIIFLEINAPFDPNKHWDDKLLGQPSILYSAYVEHTGKVSHAILELTGHGAGAKGTGAIQYDLSSITSADELLNLGLVSSFKVK